MGVSEQGSRLQNCFFVFFFWGGVRSQGLGVFDPGVEGGVKGFGLRVLGFWGLQGLGPRV